MLIAPKRLKLRTSNLTYVFPGTVRTQIFPKRGVFKNVLGGDMHSHERLLVYYVFFIFGFYFFVFVNNMSHIRAVYYAVLSYHIVRKLSSEKDIVLGALYAQ